MTGTFLLTSKQGIMTSQQITINGKEYPVVFTLLTMSNFEEITEKGFFEANMSKTNVRLAIVVAAALAADSNTKLTIEEMRGGETFDDYKQINEAFTVVMNLAQDFFKIPTVEETEDKKGETEKN
jgi:hypothetical protein